MVLKKCINRCFQILLKSVQLWDLCKTWDSYQTWEQKPQVPPQFSFWCLQKASVIKRERICKSSYEIKENLIPQLTRPWSSTCSSPLLPSTINTLKRILLIRNVVIWNTLGLPSSKETKYADHDTALWTFHVRSLDIFDSEKWDWDYIFSIQNTESLSISRVASS